MCYTSNLCFTVTCHIGLYYVYSLYGCNYWIFCARLFLYVRGLFIDLSDLCIIVILLLSIYMIFLFV